MYLPMEIYVEVIVTMHDAVHQSLCRVLQSSFYLTLAAIPIAIVLYIVQS